MNTIKELKNIKKILILQYKPFGDVLLNTGYLPYLKRKFPDATIDYLIRKPYDIVLEDNENVNKLITFKKVNGINYFFQRISIISRVRKENYDLVIDQLKGSGSAIITFFSGAKYRLGYRENNLSFAYNILATKGPLRYYAAMKFDLLKPIGILEESFQLHYKIKDESIKYIDEWLSSKNLNKEKIICVAPGSPIKNKKWYYKNYAEVCDKIINELGYKIVLMGAPYEANDIKNVKKEMKNDAFTSPKTTYNEAGALITKADLLLCNDGGLNHLSVAMNTTSLALFGNTSHKKWSASELDNHFYLRNIGFDYSNDKNITFGITVDEVFDKVKEILQVNASL